MSETWQGKAGNWYVSLTNDEYQFISEVMGNYDTLQDFTQGTDGKWYALRDSVLPPDPDGMAWLDMGIIASQNDFNMVFITLSTQASILG